MGKSLSEGKNLHNGVAKSFSRSQLEIRYPMFDRRLVEYCLALPAEQHRLGEGRRLIRRAMQGVLPDEIRLRNNKRYSANPGIQKDISENLQEWQDRLEHASAIPKVGKYVDLEKIRRRLTELPELVAEGKQREFKLGATTRALGLAEFLADNFQKKA